MHEFEDREQSLGLLADDIAEERGDFDTFEPFGADIQNADQLTHQAAQSRALELDRHPYNPTLFVPDEPTWVQSVWQSRPINAIDRMFEDSIGPGAGASRTIDFVVPDGRVAIVVAANWYCINPTSLDRTDYLFSLTYNQVPVEGYRNLRLGPEFADLPTWLIAGSGQRFGARFEFGPPVATFDVWVLRLYAQLLLDNGVPANLQIGQRDAPPAREPAPLPPTAQPLPPPPPGQPRPPRFVRRPPPPREPPPRPGGAAPAPRSTSLWKRGR